MHLVDAVAVVGLMVGRVSAAPADPSTDTADGIISSVSPEATAETIHGGEAFLDTGSEYMYTCTYVDIVVCLFHTHTYTHTCKFRRRRIINMFEQPSSSLSRLFLNLTCDIRTN